MKNRPEYIIKIHQDWRYGPRARFWDILYWRTSKSHPDGGWWSPACNGGLSYTKWGMKRAINKRLKKMKFGYKDSYFNLDGSVFKGIK